MSASPSAHSGTWSLTRSHSGTRASTGLLMSVLKGPCSVNVTSRGRLDCNAQTHDPLCRAWSARLRHGFVGQPGRTMRLR
jgi:hypothetical protein